MLTSNTGSSNVQASATAWQINQNEWWKKSKETQREKYIKIHERKEGETERACWCFITHITSEPWEKNKINRTRSTFLKINRLPPTPTSPHRKETQHRTKNQLPPRLPIRVISYFISSKPFYRRQQDECAWRLDIIGRVPLSRCTNDSLQRNQKKIKLKPSKPYSMWL